MSNSQMPHISVLYEEVLHWLQLKNDGLYIDGTLGYGGHTQGILERTAPNGRVLGFDRDTTAIAHAKERVGSAIDRLTILHAPYSEMGTLAKTVGFGSVDGILLDIGVSSMQLDRAERGFSFQQDAPLDMRMDQSQGRTAAELLNTISEEELRDILWKYGEESQGRKLAHLLVENRPFERTLELADFIASHKYRKGRTHPATLTFQALRIAVNDELGELEHGLSAALSLLKTGGRLAVISFHSLEDRMVKHTFREWANDCVCSIKQPICICDKEPTIKLPIRSKAIKPSAEELKINPRSRSARLRIAEKL